MVLALDRAGMVGADGATHAGVFDIAFLRCVPNVSVACPADEAECYKLLSTAFAQDHCVAVRYPRGSGVGTQTGSVEELLPFGRGEVRRLSLKSKSDKLRIAILAFGTLLYPCLEAAEELDASVANMRWAKPLDTDLLLELGRTHSAIVTVEEGALMGGAGSAVLEALQEANIVIPVLRLGVSDQFTVHGDPAKILSQLGLDAPGIARSIKKRFGIV
jgi:1-deoxy-D-xylulose-5-phosphate synthase